MLKLPKLMMATLASVICCVAVAVESEPGRACEVIATVAADNAVPPQNQIAPVIAPVAPDDDALIAVAKDVSPELAKTLEAARAKDPASFRAAAAKLAKRLSSLAVLRERKPELYKLRVEELRVQGQLDGLKEEWASARLGNRVEEAQKIEGQIRKLASTLVDLNLRSRGLELAQIDALLRSMLADYRHDVDDRNQTIERVVNALRDGTEVMLGGRAPVDGSARKANADSVVPAGPNGAAPVITPTPTPTPAPAPATNIPAKSAAEALPAAKPAQSQAP